MASQLRLHVLLPIALLGLLGAGFGAYAVGNKPAGSDPSGVPLITTHPDKTKPKPHQQKLDDADWVKGLQAWCAGVDGRIQAIDKPQTVADFESALGEYVQVWDSAEPSFMKLGLPKKQQRVAIRLRANIKASVAPGNAIPLLGQSFLQRFASWSIDNERQVLLLKEREALAR